MKSHLDCKMNPALPNWSPLYPGLADDLAPCTGKVLLRSVMRELFFVVFTPAAILAAIFLSSSSRVCIESLQKNEDKKEAKNIKNI